MRNLSPINDNKDVVTKEYVDNASVASAEKLTTDSGSSTVPVYFKDGKPTVCTYTLGSMCKESASDYEKAAVTAEKFAALKNDIALNRTTLGTQRKNLLDWKNATYSTSLRLTQTKTESGISVTSTGSWAVTAYKLPTLEVGTAYIFSTTISDLSVAGGKAYIMISKSTSSSNIVKATEITSNGTATIKFEATSNTMYVLFLPNYSDTVYTNSFTASNIMLRYADIIDATYEPYQPSVQEQTAYSLSVSGKSTSSAISYSGVPTLICLTPNTADSTAGGLYMINSAGAVVKLIEKTGVVVAAASSSKTFTITNNTSTVMDVCISRCWGR